MPAPRAHLNSVDRAAQPSLASDRCSRASAVEKTAFGPGTLAVKVIKGDIYRGNEQDKAMQNRYRILLGMAMLAAVAMVRAEPQVLHSGLRQTLLIELYTSEGCSSCPPAERYLNSLKQHPQLWKSYVPLALHVDYWDYIGWKDRFARPEHGRRQSHYAQLQRARTVYTPAFFVNGRSWRRFANRHPGINTEETGQLKVTLEQRSLTAQWQPQDKTQLKAQLNVALLGMGLTTEIGAGERRGRHARHEFVVLALREAVSADGRWQMRLPDAGSSPSAGRAVAVWVSRPGRPEPLQAVGGYLKP